MACAPKEAVAQVAFGRAWGHEVSHDSVITLSIPLQELNKLKRNLSNSISILDKKEKEPLEWFQWLNQHAYVVSNFGPFFSLIS